MNNFNLESMMGMVKKLTGEMNLDNTAVKEKLRQVKAEGTAGGGMVTVTINGQYHIEDLQIKDDIINVENKMLLQQTIIAAFYNATENIKAKIKEAIKETTGGLDLPLDGIL